MLKEVGIESALVQSPKMNHEWIMIKIDGQWYHTDPTWDNAIYVTKKTASRNYFMRNISEYQNGKCLKMLIN